MPYPANYFIDNYGTGQLAPYMLQSAPIDRSFVERYRSMHYDLAAEIVRMGPRFTPNPTTMIGDEPTTL